MATIPFNKPFLSGNEMEYIRKAVDSGKLSGNGSFTKQCQSFFENRFGFKKTLLTSSCTDALEMAAILSDIKPGDEVIVPSFTFVSSVLAFIRQGAVPKFCDSERNNPNMDPNKLESLITDRTRVIVPVHYAGVACDMDPIMDLASTHRIHVVEDAAQAIDSYYKNRPLGSIGNTGCFSFHETKNIIAGEGGMIAINDSRLTTRAEIIWEKGTNRAQFFRGEIDKYGWVDTGSSFLPSEITAAFLYAQLENMDIIQNKRKGLWNNYYNTLQPLAEQEYFSLPDIPDYATNNAHMFYIVCRSLKERSLLIDYLRSREIMAVFHYQSLHTSQFCKNNIKNSQILPNADRFADCLLRLPLYYSLTEYEQSNIIDSIHQFYKR